MGERFDALADGGRVTIAFLASGIEGIKVRITARGDDDTAALALLDQEEIYVRALIVEKLGDIIFGVDDESMEDVVASLLLERRLTLGRRRITDGWSYRQSIGQRSGALEVVSRGRRELRLGGQI